MPLLARYASVLRGTGAAGPLAASLLGRLSLGTTGLALLLLVHEHTRSYAQAGAAAAAFAVCFALSAPLRARRADRRGPYGVVLACGLLHPAALVAVVLLAVAGAPGWVLVAAAAAAGSAVPPLGSVMRSLWGLLVPADRLPVAYSLESVAVELCFVGGPLVVTVCTALRGPAVAVLASAAFALTGSVWLARSPALRAVPAHHGATPGHPLRSGAVRTLLLVSAAMGAGFGAVEVAMPAWVQGHGGRPGSAGLLLAVFSLGSMAGGLAYGAVHPRTDPQRQFAWLSSAVALGTVLPLLASAPLAMGVLLVAYGSAIAPYATVATVLLGRAAPVGATAEAFAWSTTALFAGSAGGSAVAGLVVSAHGPTAALGLLAATGAALLAAAVGGRRSLARG